MPRSVIIFQVTYRHPCEAPIQLSDYMSLEFIWTLIICSSIRNWSSFLYERCVMIPKHLSEAVRDRWVLLSPLEPIWILCAGVRRSASDCNQRFGSRPVDQIGILIIWRNGWARSWIMFQRFHTVPGNHQWICSTVGLFQNCSQPSIFLNNCNRNSSRYEICKKRS